jgi:hypothetical protein
MKILYIICFFHTESYRIHLHYVALVQLVFVKGSVNVAHQSDPLFIFLPIVKKHVGFIALKIFDQGDIFVTDNLSDNWRFFMS